MSGSVPPIGKGVGARAVMVLGGVLDMLGARSMRDLAEAAVLLHAHPPWAIWLPVGGREWVAVRPASSQPPALDIPSVWVTARTAGELAEKMMRAEDALSGGPGS
jgi:hypothetical protein